jgi:hypothetical protein
LRPKEYNNKCKDHKNKKKGIENMSAIIKPIETVIVDYTNGQLEWRRYEGDDFFKIGASINYGNLGEKKRVFTDMIAYKKNLWCRQWQRLEEKEQKLIWALYGKDVLRNEYINNIEKIFSPDKLRSKAMRAVYLMGWNKPCTRCGGSGHYSYCERFGTTCFKCDGNKLQTVTPTKREIESWLKKYPEGIFNSDDYKKDLIKGKGQYKVKRKEAATN